MGGHVNLTAALCEVFLPREGEFKRSLAFAYCGTPVSWSVRHGSL